MAQWGCGCLTYLTYPYTAMHSWRSSPSHWVLMRFLNGAGVQKKSAKIRAGASRRSIIPAAAETTDVHRTMSRSGELP
jgi:hypothetical protein